MTVAHDNETLTRFQQGERRFVFAAPRSGDALVELLDGTATERRAFTRAALTCPVPGCSTPAITTVSRVGGRDGYRHLATNAAEHTPESLFHLEGKAQIARWLRGRLRGADVVEERRTDARGSRVADVLVTLQGGRRIAVEIQYAALTPDEWATRHESYRSQDIIDVWLFGHVGAQLRGRDGIVRLNPTHLAVVNAGLPLLWFNPLQLRIGRATNEKTERLTSWTVHADEVRAGFEVEPLGACDLGPFGITSARERQLDEATAAWRAVRQAALAAAEERRALQDEREADRLETEARRAAEQLEREAEAAARQADAEARRSHADAERSRVVESAEAQREVHRQAFVAWAETPDGKRASAEFIVWPSWLDVDTAWSSRATPRIWQWWVWDRLVRERIGALDMREILTTLASAFDPHFNDEQRARGAVFSFCRALEDAGILRPIARGRWVVEGVPRR